MLTPTNIRITLSVDHTSNMMYVQGCYKLENYCETVLVCSDIIEKLSDEQEKLKCDITLLKGKALFYVYQRKIWYVMENRSTISKAEEKRLIEECFQCMMGSINLLGTALDNLYVDIEGSQLLDWAMMDCIREANKLNKCYRCLLCRQYCTNLCKSHIFPKFILKNAHSENPNGGESEEQSEGSSKGMLRTSTTETPNKSNVKPFLFGLNKHQMKSAGDCWLWMCCKKCEGIMTQNAENYFSRLFPPNGEIEYSSWLFNYCCTILFRTLSCVKFPRTLNDEEVYNSFLYCRMHLLSLPIKFEGQSSVVSKTVEYQLRQLSQTISQELKPFLLITPHHAIFKTEGIVNDKRYMVSIPWLAPHRLVDGRKDLAGLSHFFVAYCDGVSMVLKYLPSSKYHLPDTCCISPKDGKYVVPKDAEAVDNIPPGLLVLRHRSTLKMFNDMTESLRQMGTRTAEKMALNTLHTQNLFQMLPTAVETALSSRCMNSEESTLSEVGVGTPITPNVTESGLTNAQLSHSNKPQMSLLPPEFKITRPLPNSQVDKCIKLPQGHRIVLHHVDETQKLSCFVAIGSSGIFSYDKPYVIFLHDGSHAVYIDGAFITASSNEYHMGQFLVNHAMYMELRNQLAIMHGAVETTLVLLLQRAGFMNLKLLIEHIKCRHSIRGSEELPALDIKCSPEGCWYCSDLCHCCLKPAHPWSKGEASQDIPYRFCSKKCMGLYCFHPSKMPQSMFVIDHRDEFKENKFKGPSILDILYISRKGEQYNTVEFVNFCVGHRSEGLPLDNPYILWQIRDIDSQFFLNFLTTVECIPLEPLWPSLLGNNENVIALQEVLLQMEPKLSCVVKAAVQALGCENVEVYSSAFDTTEKQ